MKKGFTLVEIMVVVVIMGILAAVGVPKLFGLIAKARASEVPVAAGTYVSLQNAYLHENNGIGSWKNIGYGAPGNGQTEYFEYSGCINGTIPFAAMEPDMPGWQASNRSGLNSCKTGSAWAVIIDPAGEREIDYRQIISSPECAALTVSWGSVGETVEGMCETTGELHVAGTENKEPNKPETPTNTDEPSSDPEETPQAQQQSQAATENPEPKQGDCNALAESMKGKGADKGNKYGWVCVSACGVFAPPGKARNAGFDTGTLQKKKDTGGNCEKVEPETQSGSGENQGTNGTTTSGEGTSTQGSGGSGGGSVSGGGDDDNNENNNTEGSVDLSGYQGSGEPHEYDPNKDVCLKENETDASKCDEWDDNIEYLGCTGTGCPHKYDKESDVCLKKSDDGSKCEEWEDNTDYKGCEGETCPHKYDKEKDYCLSETPNGKTCLSWQAKSEFPGWAGSGTPHLYNSNTDYCLGSESEGTCDGNYRPNSECKTWSAKSCNNNGGNITKNKENCGTCSKWK